MRQPYRERREILELLDFAAGCHVCPRFEDGETRWESVCERELEGVVAKRLGEPYRPSGALMRQAKELALVALSGRAGSGD